MADHGVILMSPTSIYIHVEPSTGSRSSLNHSPRNPLCNNLAKW